MSTASYWFTVPTLVLLSTCARVLHSASDGGNRDFSLDWKSQDPVGSSITALIPEIRFRPTLSKQQGYPVYSKTGGYGQAFNDFYSLKFDSKPIQSLSGNNVSGYIGEIYVVFVRGSFHGTKYAHISIRSKGREENVIAIVWYPPEN